MAVFTVKSAKVNFKKGHSNQPNTLMHDSNEFVSHQVTTRPLLTIHDTREYLQTSQSSLYRMEREGLITPIRHKRFVRFTYEEIQRFLASGRAA